MRTLPLPTGGTMPAFGLGTWQLGENAARRGAEVAAVRTAIRLGYRLIDTAEMYGEGGAEEVVGQAIADAIAAGEVRRDELFVVSKVHPHNTSLAGTAAACQRSRHRLGLERIDLYLLHWRGSHPLAETVQALRALVAAGHIGHWGVSNFDVGDLRQLRIACGERFDCAVNQVYYSLGERGAAHSLLPWQRAHGMPLMAYSPLDQGDLAAEPLLGTLAQRLGVTPAQLGLAWLLAQPGVCAIPKAMQAAHLRDNLAASRLTLDDDTLAELNRLFPPPASKQPLAVI